MHKTMDQKQWPRAVDCCHPPSAIDTRRSIREGEEDEHHQVNKSELVTGELVGTISAHFGYHDSYGLEEHQRNKSELVVGIDVRFASLQQNFTSTFTMSKATQPSYTRTLQHYTRISDILPFPEPVVDHRSQQYQECHTEEDRGMILPPSSDSPSTQPHVNDSSVLDIDKRVRLTARGEVLEILPSNYTYKVSKHLIIL